MFILSISNPNGLDDGRYLGEYQGRLSAVDTPDTAFTLAYNPAGYVYINYDDTQVYLVDYILHVNFEPLGQGYAYLTCAVKGGKLQCSSGNSTVFSICGDGGVGDDVLLDDQPIGGSSCQEITINAMPVSC